MAESILAGNMTMHGIGTDITPAVGNVLPRRLRASRDVGLVALAWGGSWSIVLAGFYGVFGIF